MSLKTALSYGLLGQNINVCLYSCIIENVIGGVPLVAQWKQIQLVTMRFQVQSLALLSGLRIQRCCELWCRLQMRLDLALLWLWCKLAAITPIRPLAWEFTYAKGVALKQTKKSSYYSLAMFALLGPSAWGSQPRL